MAQLILPPQKFIYSDLVSQFPTTGNPKKKVFFQAELRAIAGANATFGIIAYPSWKDGNKWVVGNKVSGTDAGAPVNKPFTGPVAFANNEIILTITVSRENKKKKKKSRKKDPRKGRWNEFARIARKAAKDKATLSRAELVFNTTISENPHLEYDVSLDMGSTTLTVQTKPSPPAPPEA